MKKFYTDPEAEIIELDSLVTTWDKESGGEVATGEDIDDLINN